MIDDGEAESNPMGFLSFTDERDLENFILLTKIKQTKKEPELEERKKDCEGWNSKTFQQMFKRMEDCTVNLRSVDLDSLKVKSMTKALKKNDTVQRIILCNTGLDDKACRYLARMLETNHSISSLDLSFNTITNSGAMYFLQALERNRTIRSLNFAGNEVSPTILQMVDDMIQQNTQMSTLPQMTTSASSTTLSSSGASGMTLTGSTTGSLGNVPGSSGMSSPPGCAVKDRNGLDPALIAQGAVPLGSGTPQSSVSSLPRRGKAVIGKPKQSDDAQNIFKDEIKNLLATKQSLEKDIRKLQKKQKILKEYENPKDFIPLGKNKFFINASKIIIGDKVASGGSDTVVYTCYIDEWMCCVKEMDLKRTNHHSIESFKREISIIQQLPSHPNICTYLFATWDDEKLRLFMTYYNFALDRLLDKYRQKGKDSYLKPTDVHTIACGIARGLKILHSNNILHRDLKSGNIFILMERETSVRRVAIADFDTAKIMKKIERTNSTIGTMDYMAPEVYQSIPYSFPADIYSFGILLYEVVRLELPYAKLSPQELSKVYKEQKHEFNLDLIDPSLSFYGGVISRCMAFDPTVRPSISQIKKEIVKYDPASVTKDTTRKTDRPLITPNIPSTSTPSSNALSPVSAKTSTAVLRRPSVGGAEETNLPLPEGELLKVKSTETVSLTTLQNSVGSAQSASTNQIRVPGRDRKLSSPQATS